MTKPAPPKTVLVVGAGVGGVALAARLATAGLSVRVVEKNDFTGGRCSTRTTADGFRFDQGPSLLLLPQIFRNTYNDLGTSLEDEGITLVKCNPNYRVVFGDGETVTMSTDMAQMKVQVEKYEGEKGFEGFLGFMQEAHRHYELSLTHVLNVNFTSLLSMLRPAFLSHLHQLHPFESVYTELAEGIWYPLGGFAKIIEGLVGIAKRNDVEFLLSSSVKQVLLDPTGKKAIGVILESGEKLSADIVVINADLVWSLNNIFPPTPRAKRLAEKPVSCSSISFYWSMDRNIPSLGSHTIFLADEYKESFDSIFKEHTIPNEPSFYVNVPTRVDPTASPEGKDSVVILVPVGHLSDVLPTSADWDVVVAKARQHVFDTLSSRLGLHDFPSWITEESMHTPISWRDSFNLHRGSILGLSHSFFNVLSFRPATRHPTISQTYFVGASTHPGTGVPICLSGAAITSEQILDDLGIPAPWKVSKHKNGEVKTLDRVHKSSNVKVVLLAMILSLSLTLFLRR
ncbi:phytoene desaturase (3,4-didehydrolycopene-forming), partial [Phenoliferia sp. Uapishka_3]